VKYPLRAGKQGADRLLADIAGDDLKPRISLVLRQIARISDAKIIDDTDVAFFRHKPIDEMAADKAAAARHDVQTRRHQANAPEANSAVKIVYYSARAYLNGDSADRRPRQFARQSPTSHAKHNLASQTARNMCHNKFIELSES